MQFHPEFIRGFHDKKEGRPFDYGRLSDSDDEIYDQIRYEAGRYFACVYDGALDAPDAMLAHKMAVGNMAFSDWHMVNS